MDRGVFKHIEQVLRDYPYIESYVESRRREFGMKNEGFGLTIAEDNQLVQLSMYRKVVDDCLASSDSDTKSLIEELYFKQHPTLTLRGVADKLNSSPSSLSRKRTNFFEAIQKKLGWMEIGTKVR